VFRRSHNLPNLLPNIDQLPDEYPKEYVENMTSNRFEGYEVVADSVEGGPEELKHLPRVEHKELSIPFNKREKILKIHPEDRKHLNKAVKIAKRYKKFKEYKVKPPKIRDYKNPKDPIYIDSEHVARRYGMLHLLKESEELQPDDDE